MSFIDRISARNRALSHLGLPLSATTDEVRSAYRSIALKTHPDHDGDPEAFKAATEAYRFLRQAGETDLVPVGGRVRTARRPSVQTVEHEVGESTRDACARLFEALPEDATRQIPRAIRRHGRNVTFVLGAPASQGVNYVSVPAGAFIDGRRPHPRLLEVAAEDLAGNIYVLPEDRLEELFPGMRSVRVEFAA